MRKPKNKKSSKKKMLYGLLSVFALTALAVLTYPPHKEQPPKAEAKNLPAPSPKLAAKKTSAAKSSPKDFTVMVVSENGRGGSGSVVSVEESGSVVLTNKHVCDLALNGGDLYVITTKNTKHKVEALITYDFHDLCTVAVVGKLAGSVKIAKRNPEMYEKATVTGHPNLFPHILSEGYFSGKQMVPMLKGVRACTENDLQNQENALFCAIFGVVPVYKTYEAQVVSSVSAPGSSGSAVLNKDGELAGVVFAGIGDFGYSVVVPVEHVRIFGQRVESGNERSRTLDAYREYVKETQAETGIIPLNNKQRLMIGLTCKVREDDLSNSKLKDFCNTF